MKHIKPLLIICFLLCWSTILLAQQGNMAAGGDALGTGGNISYSIGQVDYLMYNSDQGSLNFGLQQPWIFTIPPVYEIPDLIIGDGEMLCFNATETVIVAGDGKQFTIQPGGHADIIAGQNIIMSYGTSVEHGGSLHAWISDVFCDQPESLLASFELHFQPEPAFAPVLKETFFKVYPNPTTSTFTLELTEAPDDKGFIAEIYNMLGHRILRKEIHGSSRHEFDLSAHAPGICLVRVIVGNDMGVGKVVRQ